MQKLQEKNPSLDFTDENSQNRTCKECEKKTFLILQMKTHIRDNHAEYRKIETSGLNPNRFEPKFCLENVKKNIFGFIDENSYKIQSCRILKILNKWWSFSD